MTFSYLVYICEIRLSSTFFNHSEAVQKCVLWWGHFVINWQNKWTLLTSYYIYMHTSNWTEQRQYTNLLFSLPPTDISKLTCQTVSTSNQTIICVTCSTLDYIRNELESRIHLLIIWLTKIKSLFETMIPRPFGMYFWMSIKQIKTFLYYT